MGRILLGRREQSAPADGPVRPPELERLRAGLTDCIGCGCLSLDRCKLANPDDRAACLGPGARYWIGDRPLA